MNERLPVCMQRGRGRFCITKETIDKELADIGDIGHAVSWDDIKSVKFMPVEEFNDKVTEGYGWGYYIEACSGDWRKTVKFEDTINFCERVDEIRKDLKKKDAFPPIALNQCQCSDRELYDVIDGNHRAVAFTLEGFKKLPVVTFNKKFFF